MELRGQLLQLSGDGGEFLVCIQKNVKQIGAAAYLAVFHVGLAAAGGGVDGGDVPFAATRALKARLHRMILEKVRC